MACKCNVSTRYICEACLAAHRNREREDAAQTEIRDLKERLEELETEVVKNKPNQIQGNLKSGPV